MASPLAAEVLSAMRAYRTAEAAMRRRTRESMQMGENDLTALRYLLKAQGEGRVVTPGMLADHLGMKSASVTVMLDRLTTSGHLDRRPHPSDRRSLAVVATPGSDDEVRATLGRLHRRMITVTSRLDEQQAEAVRTFLLAMTEAASQVDTTDTAA
ncbi:MarR family winged helix-turn-helix transcriptional regulator [Herbiconiux solani]|uniref:MarR family winged helix-turn-helix transcriptional regulator n=1 Tax=Herbiconiux solani TaxID=661329 RepID=UPI001FE05922|nr:MarR family transcriptional regulator [Herbiconiux solani]